MPLTVNDSAVKVGATFEPAIKAVRFGVVALTVTVDDDGTPPL
jgi:hypothetical protein